MRREFINLSAQTINDAARIAVNVDAALFGAGIFSCGGFMRSNVPTPMKIGNFCKNGKTGEAMRALSVTELVTRHVNVKIIPINLELGMQVLNVVRNSLRQIKKA